MGSRTVFLVRHGTAEQTGVTGDASRHLTEEGRADFQAHALSLAPKVALTRVVTSPFVRAKETAKLLAESLGNVAVEEDEELSSGFFNGREILRRAGAAANGTALVGHNPELAQAIALAAGRSLDVPPGTVAALAFDGGSVSLLWIASPPPKEPPR